MRSLIRFSIDNALLVVLVGLALAVVAALRLPGATIDVFPELNAPTVVVMTEAPGLAAEEVELLVTFPIESAMGGLTDVRRVRSTSAMGLSIAFVEFEWDQDIHRARQLVGEQLNAVREVLPEGAHAEMTPVTSITGEILLLTVSSPDGSMGELELRSFAEFDLRNRLLSIAGVAEVSVIGGRLPEYQVLVDPEHLALHGLSVGDIVAAARGAHNPNSAGYLDDVEGHEMPILQGGRVTSVGDLGAAPVVVAGRGVRRIDEVAEVLVGAAPQRGTGADGGHPAVVLTVQKAPGSNTLAVTAAVDELLDRVESTLPSGIAINRQIFRQADFIERSVGNVLVALRDAALIVSLILALFLLNARTLVVTLSALPLSLAAGLLAIEALGETLNVMTLGGLAIAVGSLVDDAIIDVENVYRRLKQAAALPAAERPGVPEVVFEASNEIRPSMVFATWLIVLVFVPLFFLDGVEGRFFRPLGIAFVASIGASLLVALTVTPALCRLLLKGGLDTGRHADAPLVRLLKRLYEPTLRLALRWRGTLLFAVAGLAAAALALATTFGSSFLPEFNEGTYTVGLYAPAGTSLAASDRMAAAVETQLLALEGVRSVTRRTGRAERDEHAEPVSNSEIDVTLNPGYPKEAARQAITDVLASVPGITSNVGQPLEHRLSHILSGTPAAIAISVFGDDLARLRQIASEIEAELQSLPGTRDVAANRELRIQAVPVEFDHTALFAAGISVSDAAEQIRTAVFGASVAEVYEGSRRTNIAVRYAPELREGLDDLRRLVLRSPTGVLVRLEDVARVGVDLAPYLIARENLSRKALVTLNVAAGANLGHLVAAVRERVDPIAARHGCTVHYGGQFEAQRSASRRIASVSALVLLLSVALLWQAVASLRVALLVLVNLPLALIGGVVAVFVTESQHPVTNLTALFLGVGYVAPVLSIAGIVGFIALFGIAVRNGILLVNHYRHLIEKEHLPLPEAILRGSTERLVPILMTALTAALALLPIVWAGEQPGNEILAPLSVVIVGGLLTSTFLNLIVVPAGYAAVHRVRR
ncbi:MAG: CusA/CzcA family heavy metal efflux RND transporter [Planctomycetaceae bacterium]|nr:CusA/CzcA family heavy metal efflux RND transporter [Planctomycetaceae bacterium]